MREGKNFENTSIGMADNKLREIDNKNDEFLCEEIDHNEIEIIQVRNIIFVQLLAQDWSNLW